MRKHTKKQEKEQLARALADYDNLRKRVEREKEEHVRLASLKIVVRLLPFFDMLEQTQKHLKDSGLEMVVSEFKQILKEEGVVEIDAKPGVEFDQQLHEAVEVVEGKDLKRSGKISEVVVKGWQFIEGPVIRPAKVKVYSRKKEK